MCSPGRMPAVVEVPQLRPLPARIPLAEVVAQLTARAPSRASAPRRGGRRRTARRSRSLAIVSSSTGVCRRLRDSPVSRTRPSSIASCTEATTSRQPTSATRRSRNASTSGKSWPVATCSSGNGQRRRRERLLGQAQQHRRVLAAAEQQRRALALGRHLADDVDRLGLERLEASQGRAPQSHVAHDAGTCRPHSVFSRPAQRPSRPRARAACSACSRSTRSPGRAARCRAGRARRSGPHVLLPQSASGLSFTGRGVVPSLSLRVSRASATARGAGRPPRRPAARARGPAARPCAGAAVRRFRRPQGLDRLRPREDSITTP